MLDSCKVSDDVNDKRIMEVRSTVQTKEDKRERSNAGGRDGSGTRAGQRGHSLARTKVRRTEDPLDEIIEAMIQPGETAVVQPQSGEAGDQPPQQAEQASVNTFIPP